MNKLCAMNIEAKKLSFIQEFLKINNEEIIDSLESLLHKSKSKIIDENLKPKTLKELNNEIDLAIEDEKNNKGIKAQDLKQKIQEWC